nr:hypothetical protein [Tanacetum cinerariifolium]
MNGVEKSAALESLCTVYLVWEALSVVFAFVLWKVLKLVLGENRSLHIPAIPATDDSPEVPERTPVETILNMSPENKEHYQSEKEAIHLLLIGIGDEIYSTVDACKTAHDISNASTKYKAKEIAKPITPPSESAFEEDSDLEQAQRDKDMQKNLALIAKYFKKIYKPTNKNLGTYSNSRNKNEILLQGSQVVQQSGIQCFNCKEFCHFAKECGKPKRVKDYKEKMLLGKQAEKGVPLQVKQADWIANTYKEIDKQELEAHYNYMEKTQEVPTADLGTDTEPFEHVQYDVEYNMFSNERQHSEQPESINNTCVVEKVDSNVIPNSPDMCNNDIQTEQNAKECDDERAALANLIPNLTLDTEENKNILKQLKKANALFVQ